MTRAIELPIREREDLLVTLERAILEELDQRGEGINARDLLRTVASNCNANLDDVAQALGRLSSAVHQGATGLVLSS